ncbi:MAG: aminotransferase class I/II-fold pyridoxal phosphate-dependent enzyme [Gammaproteobacteria bacterium]|nr:aminotransferase class I/II-fold pyridoxal phosphate-dependent enzyme [Gammaproteobacteria bacterium]
MSLADLDRATLAAMESDLTHELDLTRANKLALDLTRGKPAADQLDLSAGLNDALAGNYIAADGTDSRNYGALTGLPEAKTLGAEIMGTSADQIICWGNSSLTLMRMCVDIAMHHGLWGDARSWSGARPPKMITPVPGYDRHFTICASTGIEMINVDMSADGPDMQAVTRLVSENQDIKGIWCVPKYSNPTGCIYSPQCVEQMANLPAVAAADDFVVFWDNAYAVHDFNLPRQPISSIMQFARRSETQDHVIMFASTSKITYPSGGLAFLASSPGVLKVLEQHLSTSSIGPDKVNQLRHARFLSGRLEQHMTQHAALIKPKFELVQEALSNGLGGLNIATWTRPEGGYFVSVDTRPGLAHRVGELCASAGLSITRPGATFPHGEDPQDSNLRIAPTFASVEELKIAMHVLVLCIKLASVTDQTRLNAATGTEQTS